MPKTKRRMPGLAPSYDPREDSFLLEKWVKKLARGRVLDMGTGSGIQAIAAAELKEVKEVIGVDVQKITIGYCKKNIKNPKIAFLASDLFLEFTKGKNKEGTFDTIIFNAPYLPSDRKFPDPALDGGKHGYETIERFLKEANDCLENEGIILLLFSSLTKKEKVDGFVKENLLESVLLEEQGHSFERLFAYKISKSPLLKELCGAGLKGIAYFSKGKRGLVYKALYKGKKVAIKIQNPKSAAIGKIEHEAAILLRLNKKRIGPNLLLHTEKYLVMEFIEGVSLEEFVKKAPKKKAINALLDVLDQMKTLDDLGITKEEMAHPQKHIIIAKKPVLIDFERAHFALKPSNLTQFCQYLTSTHLSELLRGKNINIDKEKLIGLAKAYKNSAQKERQAAFKRIKIRMLSS